jgi:hypothetical protein
MADDPAKKQVAGLNRLEGLAYQLNAKIYALGPPMDFNE